MDIRRKFQQVRVGIHENGLVSSLEKVAASPLPSVYPARVAERKILYDARQRDGPHLNCEMGMVCQQGKSQSAVAIALDSFLKEKKKTATVLVVEKDVLTSIPPKDDVVHRARIMDPWFT
jgi:hypothetical protein